MGDMSNDRLPILLTLNRVSQYYGVGASAVCVLDVISFTLRRGDACAIVGGSGSGKSTLLNLLGLLERPALGQMCFEGVDVLTASAATMAYWRNRQLGFVFQAFNLLPHLTALDNVALPLRYRNHSRQSARSLAMEQLCAVGLAHRAHHRPCDLSGGQRQRVAIARALVGQPSLILADEPTGNLDRKSAREVVELLLRLHREKGVTLVVVTHDVQLAKRFTRRVEVVAGKLHERIEHVST